MVAGELDRAQREHSSPVAAISSILERRAAQAAAVGTSGVGSEHAGDVGVDLATSALNAAARRPLSCRPPLPTSSRRSRRHLGSRRRRGSAAGCAARSRSPLTSRILALPCRVGDDAGLAAVNDEASSRARRAPCSSAIDFRSPAVSSMSISRPGWTDDTLVREGDRARRSPCPSHSTTMTSLPCDACGRRSRRRLGCGRRRRPRCRRTSAPGGPRRWKVPVPTVGRSR